MLIENEMKKMIKRRLIIYILNILPLSSLSIQANPFEFLTESPNVIREEGGDLTAVTGYYGSLTVEEGKFSAESNRKPWSSWWYPVYLMELFQEPHEISTLERYDRYVRRSRRKIATAAAFERQNAFDSRAANWAGLCDGWALASLYLPEPVKAVTLNRITFRIRDLKALSIKTFEQVKDLPTYGQRNNGRWDSIYQDVYPDQFHKFIQAELFLQKNSFIMDHDAGVEVWNTPVWKAITKLTSDPNNNGIMRVKTWLYTASPHVEDLNFLGTKEVVRIYTYNLYGEREPDGHFYVKSGEWTDDSRWDHPDFLIALPNFIERNTENSQLDIEIIDEILAPAYQH